MTSCDGEQSGSATPHCYFCKQPCPLEDVAAADSTAPLDDSATCTMQTARKLFSQYVCEKCCVAAERLSSNQHFAALTQSSHQHDDNDADDDDPSSMLDNAGDCVKWSPHLHQQHSTERARRADELNTLQKCWTSVRSIVRAMYTHGQAAQPANVGLVEEIIRQLCERDAPQLYQRLEAMAREHMLVVRFPCLSVIVDSADDTMDEKQACAFIEAILHQFDAVMRAVEAMTFVDELNKQHLEKFGCGWRMVNEYLFDLIVYQTPLVQTSLTRASHVLAVDVQSASELQFNDSTGVRRQPSNNALELARRFRVLHGRLMDTRSRWQLAAVAQQVYAQREIKLYKATLRAKRRMLKEDIAFFKQQRQMLHQYVASWETDGKHKQTPSAIEDMGIFERRLREILSRRRQGDGQEETCGRCGVAVCACDECSISHLIGCGIVPVSVVREVVDGAPTPHLADAIFDRYTDAYNVDDICGDTEEENDTSPPPTEEKPKSAIASLSAFASRLVWGDSSEKSSSGDKSDGDKGDEAKTAATDVKMEVARPTAAEEAVEGVMCTRDKCACRPLIDNSVAYVLDHKEWELPIDDTARMFPGLPMHIRRTNPSALLAHRHGQCPFSGKDACTLDDYYGLTSSGTSDDEDSALDDIDPAITERLKALALPAHTRRARRSVDRHSRSRSGSFDNHSPPACPDQTTNGARPQTTSAHHFPPPLPKIFQTGPISHPSVETTPLPKPSAQPPGKIEKSTKKSTTSTTKSGATTKTAVKTTTTTTSTKNLIADDLDEKQMFEIAQVIRSLQAKTTDTKKGGPSAPALAEMNKAFADTIAQSGAPLIQALLNSTGVANEKITAATHKSDVLLEVSKNGKRYRWLPDKRRWLTTDDHGNEIEVAPAAAHDDAGLDEETLRRNAEADKRRLAALSELNARLRMSAPRADTATGGRHGASANGVDPAADLSRILADHVEQEINATANGNCCGGDAAHGEHHHQHACEESRGRADGKHGCNCWHCEMFGDGNFFLDAQKGSTYNANAERLRLKLESRRKRAANDPQSANERSPSVPSADGDGNRRQRPSKKANPQNMDIDSLLDFIEGDKPKKASKKPQDTAPPPKQKKQKAKKAKQKPKTKAPPTASNVAKKPATIASPTGKTDDAVDKENDDERADAASATTTEDTRSPSLPVGEHFSSSEGEEDGDADDEDDETALEREALNALAPGETPDMVLLPCNRRLDELSADDRDVELFKRAVAAVKPRPNRPKVHLNIARLMQALHS